jgi:hypothetical protein
MTSLSDGKIIVPNCIRQKRIAAGSSFVVVRTASFAAFTTRLGLSASDAEHALRLRRCHNRRQVNSARVPDAAGALFFVIATVFNGLVLPVGAHT